MHLTSTSLQNKTYKKFLKKNISLFLFIQRVATATAEENSFKFIEIHTKITELYLIL